MAWTLDGSGAGVGTFSGSGAGPESLAVGFSAGGSDNDHYWFIGYTALRMAEGSNDERVTVFGVTDDTTTQNLTEILRYRQTVTGFAHQIIVQVWGARNSDFATPVDVESTVGIAADVTFANTGNKVVIWDLWIFLNTSAPTSGSLKNYIEGGICERDGASSSSMTTVHAEALGTDDFVVAAAIINQSSPQPISGWNMDTDLDTNTTLVTGTFATKVFARAAVTTPANTTINKVETGDETNTCHWALRLSTVAMAVPFPDFGDAALINADGDTVATCSPSLLGIAAVKQRRKGRKTFLLFLEP